MNPRRHLFRNPDMDTFIYIVGTLIVLGMFVLTFALWTIFDTLESIRFGALQIKNFP